MQYCSELYSELHVFVLYCTHAHLSSPLPPPPLPSPLLPPTHALPTYTSSTTELQLESVSGSLPRFLHSFSPKLIRRNGAVTLDPHTQRMSASLGFQLFEPIREVKGQWQVLSIFCDAAHALHAAQTGQTGQTG